MSERTPRLWKTVQGRLRTDGQCQDGDWVEVDVPNAYEEMEANARLIAAASEMLELIQQVADLQNPRNYGAAYNDLVMEQDRLADLAQELLAKIEGGGE